MELTVSETSIIDSVRLLAGGTRFGSKNPKERELKLRWSSEVCPSVRVRDKAKRCRCVEQAPNVLEILPRAQ